MPVRVEDRRLQGLGALGAQVLSGRRGAEGGVCCSGARACVAAPRACRRPCPGPPLARARSACCRRGTRESRGGSSGGGEGEVRQRSGSTRGDGRGKRRRLGAEVAPREEEEDCLRAPDVLLERTDVVEIVDLRGASRRHGGCGPQARGRRGRTSRNTLMPGNSSSSSFLMTATAS